MADSEQVARIRAYLEQHRHSYDRDTLRRKLLDEGYDPQAVDQAMAEVYGLKVESRAAQASGDITTQVLLVAAGIFLLNLLLLPILATVLLRSGAGSWTWLVLLCIPLEIVAAIAFRKRNRTVTRGILWGLGATLALVAFVALLFGICIAILSTH